jgi:hypothetical protein
MSKLIATCSFDDCVEQINWLTDFHTTFARLFPDAKYPVLYFKNSDMGNKYCFYSEIETNDYDEETLFFLGIMFHPWDITKDPHYYDYKYWEHMDRLTGNDLQFILQDG